MVDLGTLGGDSSQAFAVNDAGQVVGCSETALGESHAFSWTQAGGMVDLGSLGGTLQQRHRGERRRPGRRPQQHGLGRTTRSRGRRRAGWSTSAPSAAATGIAFAVTAPARSSAPATRPRETSTRSRGRRRAGWSTSARSAAALAGAAGLNDAGQVVGYCLTASGERHATLWQPANVDTVAPTLQVPAGVVVDATSPTGATVGFSVSATDSVDPAPAVTCTPASGTLFPIGDTTVTCTATDASGNVATASFVVHVRGAAEQLANLAAAVTGRRPWDEPRRQDRAGSGRPQRQRSRDGVVGAEGVHERGDRSAGQEDPGQHGRGPDRGLGTCAGGARLGSDAFKSSRGRLRPPPARPMEIEPANRGGPDGCGHDGCGSRQRLSARSGRAGSVGYLRIQAGSRVGERVLARGFGQADPRTHR